MSSKRNAVIDAALRGDSARSGAFWTDGSGIYSYGLKLATVIGGMVYPCPGLDERWSVTTSAHQNVVRAMIAQQNATAA
jgi:hypothetical protein